MAHKKIKLWSSKLLAASALLAVLCGCNNQAKQQEIERQRQDSIQAAERKAEEERKEKEFAEELRRKNDSFTTAKGSFSIEQTLNLFYNTGVEQATRSKGTSHQIYHFDGEGTEEKFKGLWASWVGIPENDKAREVYNRALKKYIEGYENGWNF